MARLRAWVLVALLAAMSGCSTVRIAYNQADHILAWIADDYFDLSTEQREALRLELQRFHAWHRKTQLPDYAALLETVQQRLNAGVTSEDVDWLTQAIQPRSRAMIEQAHAEAAGLLATLSEAQLQAARKQFEKTNRKYVRENGVGAPADEQRRLRARRQIERIEHWTGPLDSTQESKIRQMSRGLPLITEAAYRERLRRQEEFMVLLQGRKSPGFALRLRDWLLQWERTRSPDYDAQLTQFIRARNGMYLQTIALLSPEQRHHVVSVVQRYQQAFRDLAAQSAALGPATQP